MSGILDSGRVGTAARRLVVTTLATLSTGLGLAGFVPSNLQAQESFLGEIIATSAHFCPRYTRPADGGFEAAGVLSDLFSLYGHTYGGDFPAFGVPDFYDRDAALRAGAESRYYSPVSGALYPGWGPVRWCVVLAGTHPSRDDDRRSDSRIAGELMATGADYCPSGWQVETAGTLPHQETINWCKATGGAGWVDGLVAQMLLFAGDTCPQDTMPAEGQVLQIEENSALFSLVGTIYGGDGRQTFALPDMASPAPGMKWCIITVGIYPSRN